MAFAFARCPVTGQASKLMYGLPNGFAGPFGSNAL
jgi:hypothetical protein